MIPEIYNSSDFAGINTLRISCYYGYEEIDPITEEFCFVVKKNGKIIFKKTNSELLQVANEGSPQDMLVAGLALYLSR